MNIDALVAISRRYGNDPEYVLAGGGNTSFKDDSTLYVKASGFSLAQVSGESFVKMDRKALAAIWEKTYPDSGDERESAVLADMMAARKPGEESKRPSVEALLHDIIPYPFVVHLHPALVNGLCCSQQGENAAREIFKDQVIWIPSTNPGYILSKAVKKAMEEYREKHGRDTPLILLQNHGIFAGAQNTDGIENIYDEVMSKIGKKINRKLDFSDEKITMGGNLDTLPAPCGEIGRTLTELAGFAAFMTGGEVSAFVKDETSFAAVSCAFTPDHIVYAGSDPLFTEAKTGDDLRRDWEMHTQKTGRSPKIAAVKGLGVFAAAATEKAASLALELFRDTIKVAVYAESFGGYLFMTRGQIDFINNWEVERFRSAVSTS